MNHVSKNAFEKDVIAVTGEFQLTELEQRLELVAVTPMSSYCCECVGDPYCVPIGEQQPA